MDRRNWRVVLHSVYGGLRLSMHDVDGGCMSWRVWITWLCQIYTPQLNKYSNKKSRPSWSWLADLLVFVGIYIYNLINVKKQKRKGKRGKGKQGMVVCIVEWGCAGMSCQSPLDAWLSCLPSASWMYTIMAMLLVLPMDLLYWKLSPSCFSLLGHVFCFIYLFFFKKKTLWHQGAISIRFQYFMKN
jgi:membrane-associated HD superfamily phosphohydrolase